MANPFFVSLASDTLAQPGTHFKLDNSPIRRETEDRAGEKHTQKKWRLNTKQ